MKSQLKEYRILKKVESKPENKLDCLQRLYRQFFQNHLNCSYLKEKIEIHSIYHSDIEIKIWRERFHLQLLRLLMIWKAISNLSLSFYSICCMIFFLINKSYWEVISN